MSRSKLNLSLFYDNLARVESSMGKLPTWNIGTRNSAGQISDFAEGWEHRRDGELRKSIVKTKINKRGENWRKDECNSTVTQFKQQLRLTRGNCDRFTSGNYDRVTSGNGKQMELYPGRGTCKVDRDTRESDKNSRGIERDFTEVYDYQQTSEAKCLKQQNKKSMTALDRNSVCSQNERQKTAEKQNRESEDFSQLQYFCDDKTLNQENKQLDSSKSKWFSGISPARQQNASAAVSDTDLLLAELRKRQGCYLSVIKHLPDCKTYLNKGDDISIKLQQIFRRGEMMKKVVAQFRLVCKLDIEETPKLLEFLRTGTCSVKEAQAAVLETGEGTKSEVEQGNGEIVS